jgi:hypothetical protein
VHLQAPIERRDRDPEYMHIPDEPGSPRLGISHRGQVMRVLQPSYWSDLRGFAARGANLGVWAEPPIRAKSVTF